MGFSTKRGLDRTTSEASATAGEVASWASDEASGGNRRKRPTGAATCDRRVGGMGWSREARLIALQEGGRPDRRAMRVVMGVAQQAHAPERGPSMSRNDSMATARAR
jgi:hypothetical protein